MIKSQSITLSHKGSYIILASSMDNIGLPGTYIVYAKGNPRVIYKMLRAEGILNHALFYQLENFNIVKNNSIKIATLDGRDLYKYKKGKKWQQA